MTTREGPLVTAAEVDEVITAIETFDLQAPWNEVAPNLRLTLPRRRPMPPGAENLPAREFPLGIRVGLGLDIGPAMLFISEKQLDTWGVTIDRAFEQALSNVRARVATRKQFALVHERIAGVPTITFQSREGWASSLLLLTEELARVLGSRSGLILAPMRDVIICLPLDAEPAFARYLLDQVAEADMNALDLPVFALVDGRLAHTVTLPEPQRDTGLQHWRRTTGSRKPTRPNTRTTTSSSGSGAYEPTLTCRDRGSSTDRRSALGSSSDREAYSSNSDSTSSGSTSPVGGH